MSTVVNFPTDKNMVMRVYKSFLQSKSRNSLRTSEEYDKRVREFFQLTLKKKVEFVSIEDIQSILSTDVETKYINFLINNQGNKHNTVKTKLNSVRSFYNELLKNGVVVNPMIFKTTLKKDVVHHESLSQGELNNLFEFLKGERQGGLEKYLLVKTMFVIGGRRTATFSLTWRDNFIQKVDPDTLKLVHVIKYKVKGDKWKEKPISDEFYEELQQLNLGQDKVFSIHTDTLERALERFSKKLGRNITMHSMKATAITLGYRMTKDVKLVQQLGDHEKSSTTIDIYIKAEESLMNQLSYNMSRTLDESLVTNMSHEKLLEFIMSNEDIKNMILMRLS